MTKSKRFEPIQEIASNSADALSRPMADAARKVADLERQLAQLQTYRDEYVRNSAVAGAMDAVKLQNYRSFLDRLGEAMRQHVKNLDVGRAVERFRAEEQRAADRRDQHELDDAAIRMSLAAHAESGNR